MSEIILFKSRELSHCPFQTSTPRCPSQSPKYTISASAIILIKSPELSRCLLRTSTPEPRVNRRNSDKKGSTHHCPLALINCCFPVSPKTEIRERAMYISCLYFASHSILGRKSPELFSNLQVNLGSSRAITENHRKSS